MNIRRLTHNDLLSKQRLWSVCYNFKINEDEVRANIKNDPSVPYGYGAFTEEGRLFSLVLGIEYETERNGKPVPFLGIGGVVTDPCYRRMGAVREIMRVLLAEKRAEGYVFSGLYPFNFDFYRRFGFELGGSVRTVRLPLHQLRPYAESMEARMFLPDDDREPLMDVFHAFAKRYPLAVTRTASMLKQSTSCSPYADNSYLYAIYDAGRPVAYVRFSKKRENDKNTLSVTDFAFVSHADFRRLLGFLSRFEAEYTDMEIELPFDIPMDALVADPYSVQISENCNFMFRALHAEKALACMNAADFPAFTVQVRDDFLPENSGTFRVSPGHAEPTTDAADVFMSIQALSQLMSGYVSFESALFRKDVELLSDSKGPFLAWTRQPGFVGAHF